MRSGYSFIQDYFFRTSSQIHSLKMYSFCLPMVEKQSSNPILTLTLFFWSNQEWQSHSKAQKAMAVNGRKDSCSLVRPTEVPKVGAAKGIPLGTLSFGQGLVRHCLGMAGLMGLSLLLLHRESYAIRAHLKCLHTNTHSLRNKQSKTEALVLSQNYNVIGIRETRQDEFCKCCKGGI